MIKPFPVTAVREVPAAIIRPHYVGKAAPDRYLGSHVQSAETIEKMRIAGKIAAGAKFAAADAAKPGVTTDEVDRIAHEYMCDHGAYPSTLGYRGFPKACCTSINEVICHGIPDLRPLEDGDILKIDVTAFIHGVHGDNCGTFAVGDVDEAGLKLIDVGEKAMLRGIKAALPGRPVNVIGTVIEKYVHRFGYDTVREYTGHGVHTAFHSGLVIPHYDHPDWFNDIIEPGMTFTVEPMITEGSATNEQWDDGWTVVTKDRSRVAQFEHTILITESGAEILTLP